MSESTLEVITVPEGSVLVLRGTTFEDVSTVHHLVEELKRVVGHSHWTLLDLGASGTTFEVWGPGTDLEAKVRALLARGEEDTSG